MWQLSWSRSQDPGLRERASGRGETSSRGSLGRLLRTLSCARGLLSCGRHLLVRILVLHAMARVDDAAGVSASVRHLHTTRASLLVMVVELLLILVRHRRVHSLRRRSTRACPTHRGRRSWRHRSSPPPPRSGPPALLRPAAEGRFSSVLGVRSCSSAQRIFLLSSPLLAPIAHDHKVRKVPAPPWHPPGFEETYRDGRRSSLFFAFSSLGDASPRKQNLPKKRT